MNEVKEINIEIVKDLSLYGWLFTYNPYKGKWVCYHRDTNYFIGEGPAYYDDDINNLIKTVKQKIEDGRDS